MPTGQEPDLERDAADKNSGDQIPPKLIKFRQITGIYTTGSLQHTRDKPRPGNNIGIYARVIKEEKAAHRQYAVVNFLIEATFLSQIAIAAALTALGASNASHLAITAFGSVNTVIAGVQTYLKGQGLPTRVQQYEFGLRKLREHIEDLERHFYQWDCKLDVEKEIGEIAAMYHAVRQTAEDNTPDTYKAMGGAGAKLLTKGSNPHGPSGVPATELDERTGKPAVDEPDVIIEEADGAAESSEQHETTEETPLLKKKD